MLGDPLKIDALFKFVQQQCLPRSGTSADDHRWHRFGDADRLLHQIVTKCLLPSFEPRHDTACLGEPLLYDLRTLPAAKTVKPGIGVYFNKCFPRCRTCCSWLSVDELLAQCDRCGIARLFVPYPDQVTLLIGHQRQIDGMGERSFGELYRRTYVDQRTLLQHD